MAFFSMRAACFGLVAIAASIVGSAQPSAAQAGCVELLRGGAWDYFVNTCDIGIDLDFNDQGGCGGWSCSIYVGPNSRAGVSIDGDAEWFMCYSWEGIGDVVAECDSNGACYCKE
jgi:hypothetical protein